MNMYSVLWSILVVLAWSCWAGKLPLIGVAQLGEEAAALEVWKLILAAATMSYYWGLQPRREECETVSQWGWRIPCWRCQLWRLWTLSHLELWKLRKNQSMNAGHTIGQGTFSHLVLSLSCSKLDLTIGHENNQNACGQFFSHFVLLFCSFY